MVARRGFLALAATLPWSIAAAPREDATWEKLRRGGLVLFMRHAATEPGLGDPKGFRIGDCATQRNLSAQGREDARRVGARLREERVAIERVYTSPWCRCRDTAMEAFGRAEEWEPLSSFFDFPDREQEHTETVRKRVLAYGRKPPRGNVVMVTHNVNIAALTRQSVATGEMVAVRAQGCCDLRVAGRIRP
jgi:phosphohistidine phosphatase SixA